jgi:hypothetical protein
MTGLCFGGGGVQWEVAVLSIICHHRNQRNPYIRDFIYIIFTVYNINSQATDGLWTDTYFCGGCVEPPILSRAPHCDYSTALFTGLLRSTPVIMKTSLD